MTRSATTLPKLPQSLMVLLLSVTSALALTCTSFNSVASTTVSSENIIYAESGTPRELLVSFQPKVDLSAVKANDPLLQVAASEFLNEYRDVLKLSNPQQELMLNDIQSDSLGRHYLRYSQMYQGIPVWPAELSVQINRHGQIDRLNGLYIPTPSKISTTAEIDANLAASTAKEQLNNNATASHTRLVIHAPNGQTPRLAWEILFEAQLTNSWQVFIDAINGQVIKKINRVNAVAASGSGTDLNGNTANLALWLDNPTYYLVDTSKPMYTAPAVNPTNVNELRALQGTIIIEDAANGNQLNTTTLVSSNDANTWSNPHSVSAAYNLAKAYDYFYTRHNITHLLTANESIKAVVNFNLDGSFWQPDLKVIVLGNQDNYSASLDIVAHELSHALINRTAKLIYENQSGALSEAFADIFGESAEAHHNTGVTDWLVGSALSQPLRNIANPSSMNIPTTTRPYPASMAQYIEANDPILTVNDYGGVHFNSTIISHAYYILASNIGIFDAERIFYHTLVFQLNNYSQFIDARLGAIASAKIIYGENSTQALATANAFTSVGILAGPPSQTGNITPQVPNSDATLYITAGNLARHEPSAINVHITPVTSTSANRPSVSGDGSWAAYINNLGNICLIETLTLTSPQCLATAVTATAVAISPNKKRLTFVPSGSTQLKVIDLPADITAFSATTNSTTLTITAPTTHRQTQLNTVTGLGQIDFSGDSTSIYLVAYNLADLSVNETTSIYIANIATQQIRPVIAPITGIRIGGIALGNTRDNLLTFTGLDTANNLTYIYAADLNTGVAQQLNLTAGAEPAQDAAPSFNGNDTAIIYTDTSNRLIRQNISTLDHITSTGVALQWQGIGSASYALVYRRGEFLGPNLPPEGSIIKLTDSTTSQEILDDITNNNANDGIYEIRLNDKVIFEADASDQTSDGIPITGKEILYEWFIYDDKEALISKSLGKISSAITFARRGDYTVKLVVTDEYGASDATPASTIVRVGSNNIKPIAIISSPNTPYLEIAAGQIIAFVGSGNDADGVLIGEETAPRLAYSWSISGIDNDGQAISINLSSPTAAEAGNINFTTEGVYTVRLVVTDYVNNELADKSNAASVTIKVSSDPNNNQPILNDSKPPSSGGGFANSLLLLILLLTAACQRSNRGKILSTA